MKTYRIFFKNGETVDIKAECADLSRSAGILYLIQLDGRTCKFLANNIAGYMEITKEDK